MNSRLAQNGYYLGCPVWSCPNWRGSIYPSKAPQREWLNHYSQRFNTVEGNSTFYAIPSPELARRWADQAEEGFRFALKFPRSISHDRALVGAEVELSLFLQVLEILNEADRLGPTFLQLSPYFAPRQFPAMEAFLRQLPTSFPFAVEVRHLDYFQPEAEQRLNQLLKELNMDRVVFDSRPLYSASASDDAEAKSQTRKPKSPVHKVATGPCPLVRLIGRNNVALTRPWLEEWAKQVSDWMDAGLTPFIFTHTPDDQFAPQMAREFHEALCTVRPEIEPLPDWIPPAPEQLDLF